MRTTKMVASTVHRAAPPKEVIALPLPKEPRIQPPKVTGGVSVGYEETPTPINDEPADGQMH